MAKLKTAPIKDTDNDLNATTTADSTGTRKTKESSAAEHNKNKLGADGDFIDDEGKREGKNIADDQEEEQENDDVEIVMGTEADVTAEDLAALGDPDKDMDMNEDEFIDNAGLDQTDDDGDPLNEAGGNEDGTGDDLDIPDADNSEPDADAMGQGDEENNYYSLGGDDKDALNEGKQND